MPLQNPAIIITGSEEQLETLQALLAELQLKANLTETQPISGTVSVSNFPETEPFDGNVTVVNLPFDPPTATLQNTQIARLETIRDHLADIKSYTDSLELLLTSLNGYVDGLETLLGTANTTQSSIAGFVDQLEGFTDNIEAKLDTISTNQATSKGTGVVDSQTQRVTLATDGIFAINVGAKADSVATDDTGSFSVLAFVKRLLQRFTSLLNLLPSALTATGNFKVSLAESTVTQTVSVSGSVAVQNTSFTNTEFGAAFSANQASNGGIRDGANVRNIVRGWVFSDQSGTIALEQSTDSTNWRPLPFSSGAYTIAHTGGANATPFEFKMHGRYYRMKYINGSVASTTMQMISTLFGLSY